MAINNIATGRAIRGTTGHLKQTYEDGNGVAYIMAIV